MEIIYAFGIVCIQILQDRLENFEWYMDTLNRVFNPYNLMEYAFPMVSAIDSVFGAQLLLSVAFGGWWNTMLKWILAEDRPFWWVRETSYYGGGARPAIRQGAHTCETGPGSPSGHCAAAATLFMLLQMWCSHVFLDRRMTKMAAIYSKLPLKTMYLALMSGVSAARMYVGAHFPHQCLMGALIGSFLSPSVCLFITDPYLLRASWSPQELRRFFSRHLLLAAAALALSVTLALVYMLLDLDIHWSTRMAFRWCQSADYINVKSSPMFSIVQSTSLLLGWALAVTPAVTKYRHSTSQRNIIVAALVTGVAMYSIRRVQEFIPNRRIPYYMLHFLLGLVKPYVYLRLVPKVVMVTYFGRAIRPQPEVSATSGGRGG